MMKSDLKQLADLLDDRWDKRFKKYDQRFKQLDDRWDKRFKENNKIIFKTVFAKMDAMEERIMTAVKTEVDRVDYRMDNFEGRMDGLE